MLCSDNACSGETILSHNLSHFEFCDGSDPRDHDSFASVGADLQVRTEHSSAVNETKKGESGTKTQNGNCNRLKKMIAWWRTEYPNYFEAGTKVLSQEGAMTPCCTTTPVIETLYMKACPLILSLLT